MSIIRSVRRCAQVWNSGTAAGGCPLELPPFRARKPEIRNSKPETNPKHQAGNDQNHYPAGGSWPWNIGHLNLLRVSGFGFGTTAPGGGIRMHPRRDHQSARTLPWKAARAEDLSGTGLQVTRAGPPSHCNSRDGSQAASKAQAMQERGHSCPQQAPNAGTARLLPGSSARRTLLRTRMSALLRLWLCRAVSIAARRLNGHFIPG
jgi:hypothetical protein